MPLMILKRWRWSSGTVMAARLTETTPGLALPARMRIHETKVKGNVRAGRPTGAKKADRAPDTMTLAAVPKAAAAYHDGM